MKRRSDTVRDACVGESVLSELPSLNERFRHFAVISTNRNDVAEEELFSAILADSPAAGAIFL